MLARLTLKLNLPSAAVNAAIADDDDVDVDEEEEDISEASYECRHAKAEVEERKRWQMPLNKSSNHLVFNWTFPLFGFLFIYFH